MPTKQPTTATPWTDPDDAPPLDAAFFARADLYEGGKLIRRGRPPAVKLKQLISMRVDPDVLASWRARGAGWQGQAHSLLRGAVGRPGTYYVEVWQPAGTRPEDSAEFDAFAPAVAWLDARLGEDAARLPRLLARAPA